MLLCTCINVRFLLFLTKLEIFYSATALKMYSQTYRMGSVRANLAQMLGARWMIVWLSPYGLRSPLYTDGGISIPYPKMGEAPVRVEFSSGPDTLHKRR